MSGYNLYNPRIQMKALKVNNTQMRVKLGYCTYIIVQKKFLAWDLFKVYFEHFNFFQRTSNCLQRIGNYNSDFINNTADSYFLL